MGDDEGPGAAIDPRQRESVQSIKAVGDNRQLRLIELDL